MSILSEEKIKELAYQNADVDTDRRGRETFSFDSHGLVRIARVIEAAVLEAQSKQEPVAWKPLTDVQWMSIVNLNHAWEAYDKESAIHEVVKLTEERLKANNAAEGEEMRDELIVLSKESGIVTAHNTEHLTIAGLECFAELVAAKEREECAKVCEDEAVDGSVSMEDAAYNSALAHAAAAIRGMKP